MAFERTVFNELTDLVMGRGTEPRPSPYVMGDEQAPQLIKANTPQERDRAVVTHQQQGFMRQQLQGLLRGEAQRRTFSEGTRLQQYTDYEAMEEYPDIARSLDLLAEEATMGSIKGRSLNIYSDNERVRQVLTDFFYKTLNIDSQLFFWARIMIKQGDAFLYFPMVEGRGITGARLLPTIDMERQEGLDEHGQPTVRFRHRLETGTVQEYSLWQVGHFRMLGNERRLPYGSSILSRVRRTYKMLMMAKDAVLVYRLTRAPERRVHKIFTGNMDPKDVPDYIQMVADSHKKAPLVDSRTGDINFLYQPATMDQDYYIPVNSEGAGTQIDTLPGAQNLSELGDLTMLENDLFGGLGIPKSFVKFNSDTGGSAGDGKGFAMLDMRLARLVSRIQQALIAELNRLAIIHLYLLGGDFREELGNFTLTMNSPSVQLQLMHQELVSSQLDNYVKATTPSGEGVSAMSAAQAMKEVMGMSEAQVAQNFKDQFMESKLFAEIKAAPDLLPSSGLYDDLIRFAQAGRKASDTTGGTGGGDSEGMGSAPPPPGGGGESFITGSGSGPAGGEPGGAPEAGGPESTATPAPAPAGLNEQTRRAGEQLLNLVERLGIPLNG